MKVEWMCLVALVGAVGACGGNSKPSKGNNAVVVITNNSSNNGDGCGECGADEACIDGFCQVAGCEPVCEGTACGPNGCGGMCNPCEGAAQCMAGVCEVPPTDCSGFDAEPQAWTLPTLFVDEQFDRAADTNSNECGGLDGEISYSLFDIDGDGLSDLVLTDRCDGGGVGTVRWDVHKNTGSGFAQNPTNWTLPYIFVDEQFDRLADTNSNECGGLDGEISYSVFDITGDGQPDLILTDRCDGGGVGTTRWDVHENTGSGFAAEPTTWTLPYIFVDEQFDRLADTNSNECGGMAGEFSYSVFDITGDGLPDLVLTDRCDGGGVGTVRWDVHKNTGSGFAAEPTTWTLPYIFVDEQFDRVADTNSNECGGQSGEFSYSVFDIDGDALPDLVLTDRCDGGGVGTTRWDVHLNTGSGFAADPTAWTIPYVFVDEQFDRVADTNSNECGGMSGEFSYSLMDMDGDTMPDLLLTDRCDSGGVGTARWEYYRNEGNGFAEASTSWTLPALFVDEQFDRIADTNSNECGGLDGEIAYSVMDLNGDRTMDLVLTDRCDSGGVGTARWDVHNATCN